jgi:Uri superfamily endonuclease
VIVALLPSDAVRVMPADETDWPELPGTYVLVMRLNEPTELAVGRLGSFRLTPGYYAYVGSAHGPGGLRARLGRHLQDSKPLHWHVDYVTNRLDVERVYYRTSGRREECEWTARLCGLPGASAPIPGFGSSDCRAGCRAHLVRLPDGYGPLRLEIALAA